MASADRDFGIREVLEQHRVELHAHCCRMLGSVHDADDLGLRSAELGLPLAAAGATACGLRSPEALVGA